MMTAFIFVFMSLTILVSVEVGHRMGVKAGVAAERERARRAGNHPSSDWFRP